jgi:CrcB protein
LAEQWVPWRARRERRDDPRDAAVCPSVRNIPVNVLGCLAIGRPLMASQKLVLSAERRAFVFVGVLGGFTTFATFGLDTLALAQSGLRAAALWNVAGQVTVALLAVCGGFLLGSRYE